MKCIPAIALCLTISCTAACTSMQVRYSEQESRRSIITEYQRGTRIKKGWDNTLYRCFPIYRTVAATDIKKHGVARTVLGYGIFIVPPIVDLAILPFQVLYDAAFNYRREYVERVTVSGTIVDRQGAPRAGMALTVSGATVVTDNAGAFLKTISYAGRYEPSGQIDVVFDPKKWEAVKTAYDAGISTVVAVPCQVRFDIARLSGGAGGGREDFIIEETLTAEGRDLLTVQWEQTPPGGPVIVVAQQTIFSAKNRLLTVREHVDARLRRIRREGGKLDLFDGVDIFTMERIDGGTARLRR